MDMDSDFLSRTHILGPSSIKLYMENSQYYALFGDKILSLSNAQFSIFSWLGLNPSKVTFT